MNKTLKSLFAVALTASVALAGEAKSDKDLKKVIEDQGIYVETSQKGIVLSGYVDAGYTYGFSGVNNTASQRSTNDSGTPANHSGDFNINAFKLALEKKLSDKNELTAGFRADLMVGEDAAVFRGNANATDNASDLYLHQAYVAFRAPVGNGIDFKVGKFATPVGYEVVERPANLNITYGLLWNNLQPLNHTGILSSYKVNDQVETEFGIANADWNRSDSVDTNGNGSNSVTLLASVNVKSAGGNANIKNTLLGQPQGGNNIQTNTPANTVLNDGSLFLWDMWGNWAPKFANDKLLLGFNTDLGVQHDYANSGVGTRAGEYNETFWGIALYSKYQFSKLFSLAGRAEYVHNTDGVKFGNAGAGLAGAAAGTNFQSAGSNVDLWAYTLTAGFNIWENMLLKAEYRADFGSGTETDATGIYNKVNHLAAVQVVYSF